MAFSNKAFVNTNTSPHGISSDFMEYKQIIKSL